MKVLIVCDSLRIGGIERLVLDQAYELSVQGIFCKIIVLNEPPHTGQDSFVKNERDLIENLKINITYIKGPRINQFVNLSKILNQVQFDFILAHSLRGGVLCWFLKNLLGIKTKIVTIIHQLPTLSAPLQRGRRMFYSQFCDELLIFSSSAKDDWNYQKQRNIIFKIIAQKKHISLCRNGVFLTRLNLIKPDSKNLYKGVKRLVFIGRLTKWKGIETFLEIAKMRELKNTKILLITPTSPDFYLDSLDESFRKRIQSIVGKPISEIEFRKGDLHVYPVSYENNAFTEGIGIGVLEMACLGIPSLVTKNGCRTWPELQNLGLVYEVDWSKVNTIVSTINKISIKPRNISKARLVIDIKNNLNQILVNLNDHA